MKKELTLAISFALIVPSIVLAETQVTNRANDARPSWSPSGNDIVFDSLRSGNRDLWVVSSAGGGTAVQMTTDPDVQQDPDWSPDGSTFVFRNGSGNSDLWTAPSTGGNGSVLDADGTVSDRFPSYSAWDIAPVSRRWLRRLRRVSTGSTSRPPPLDDGLEERFAGVEGYPADAGVPSVRSPVASVVALGR